MSIRQYNCVKMKSKWFKNIVSDKEFWLILLFNAVITYTYFTGDTSASMVIFLYYLQSLFIGLQYFVRLLFLGGMIGQGKPFGTKFGIAFFFLFHYGFFHLVYFIFLVSIIVKMPGSVDVEMAEVFGLVLLGNTILSTISDVKKDMVEPKLPVVVMFQPYFRIVPMHLFIFLGFNTDLAGMTKAFVWFIVLKSAADILMHIVVNKTYRDSRPPATGGWV